MIHYKNLLVFWKLAQQLYEYGLLALDSGLG